MSEQASERLLNFLLKEGSAEKVLSELRSLTKSDAPFARLAKEGIAQLKLITGNASILEMKVYYLGADYKMVVDISTRGASR